MSPFKDGIATQDGVAPYRIGGGCEQIGHSQPLREPRQHVQRSVDVPPTGYFLERNDVRAGSIDNASQGLHPQEAIGVEALMQIIGHDPDRPLTGSRFRRGRDGTRQQRDHEKPRCNATGGPVLRPGCPNGGNDRGRKPAKGHYHRRDRK